MASRDSKYPFFEKLQMVAATVDNDVKEIERKLKSSKFENPENNAKFKLIELNDEMTTYKNQSCALLEQLTGENQKYTRYRQDIEILVAEMERSTERVEDCLVGYGYKRWQPEGAFEEDCDEFPSGTSHPTPVKGLLLATCGAAEEEKQQIIKTPILADYGLTSPQYLPSALKQGSALKSAKKVHSESPERQQEKGKDNNVPYSLEKSPLPEDNGLPSRKQNQYGRETNRGKYTLGINEQLNFRSPLGSLSGNTPENETESLAVADLDSSENFGELVNSLPSGLKSLPPMGASKARTDVEMPSPEEPICFPMAGLWRRMKFTGETKENTPEGPLATPLPYAVEDEKPRTPKTPEFEVNG